MAVPRQIFFSSNFFLPPERGGGSDSVDSRLFRNRGRGGEGGLLKSGILISKEDFSS